MSKSKSLEEIASQWSQYDRPEDGDVFVHYKGGTYEIVATGFLEDSEAPCVMYRSFEKNIVWVRTAKNFFEDIEYCGKIQKRFVKRNA